MAYSTRILPHCYWNFYIILIVVSVVFFHYFYINVFFLRSGYNNQNHDLEASDTGSHVEPFQFTGVNSRKFIDMFRHSKISDYLDTTRTKRDILLKTFYDNRKVSFMLMLNNIGLFVYKYVIIII